MIDPNHPNAPFQRFNVGDTIFVRANNPWYGEMADWHKVMSWVYDQKSGLVELGLKVEGAFNYDPIEYNPDWEEELPNNLLHNGYFQSNIFYWTRVAGQWIRVSNAGFETEGCVRIDCDDGGAYLRSERIACTAGETLDFSAYVKWEEINTVTGPGFVLRVIHYLDGFQVGFTDVDSIDNPTGTLTWQRLQASLEMPVGANEFAVQLCCMPSVTQGIAFWDDILAFREETP